MGRDGRDVREAPRDADAARPHSRGQEVAPARLRPDAVDGPPRLRREAPRLRRAVPLRRALLPRVDEQPHLDLCAGQHESRGRRPRGLRCTKNIRGMGPPEAHRISEGRAAALRPPPTYRCGRLLRRCECEPGAPGNAAGPLPGGEPRPGRYHDSCLLRRAPLFAAPVEVWRSAHDRGEVVDHAVDGVSVDDGDAFIYIHAGVPGTLWRTCEFSTMKPPPSELVRLTWPLAKLRGFSREAVTALRRAGRCDSPTV
mmetsp:Transcript_22853/g.68332  ORF Transcript_22853/g.68332 Transcript_22853/m.68332 type:complete len:255 (-) Transcript_22853:21-785(-)